MSESKSDTNSRRDFLRGGAVASATAAGALVLSRPSTTRAADDEIRIGLIGVGGRGSGALENALKAAKNVKLVAAGDLFPEKITEKLKLLKDKGFGEQVTLAPDKMFSGLDCAQKVVATDCNYVIIATPPGFKAAQIRAALDAGKHVFTEKPMAVDGPTVRQCLEMAEVATKKNLGLGVGLQRHHQKGYLETLKRVKQGQIGDITSGRIFWNQASLWMKPRQPKWSDAEWQIRNWLYFTWLSGDHIVEQHIHNIDVAQWFIGKPPVAAVGMGGRQVRTDPAYGHIFDHFAVDYEYPNDVHVLSMCRQIPGCHNEVGEHLQGTKGRADFSGKTWTLTTGKKVWTYDGSNDVDPYIQEHTDLIESIRKGKPLNELKSATESNLSAIMGRMAAYTGKRVTWEQALNSKEDLLPKDLKLGPLATPKVPVPGSTDLI